jgi:hypothetical protein
MAKVRKVVKAKADKAAALKGASDARKVAKVATPSKAAKPGKVAKVAAKANGKVTKAKAKGEYVRKPGAGVEFGSDAMLTLAYEGNPKREGSKSWARYQLLLAAYAKAGGKLTVGAAIAAGFGRDDIRWGVGLGQFKVDGAKAGDGFNAVAPVKVTTNVAKAALVAAKSLRNVKVNKALLVRGKVE